MSKLWDWGIFDDCFSNGIKMSDLDGIVERRGKFLIIETKSRGVKIPTGQRRMFQNLIRLDCFMILILWGEVNKPEEYQLWFNKDGKPAIGQISSCDLNTVKTIIRLWYNYADKG